MQLRIATYRLLRCLNHKQYHSNGIRKNQQGLRMETLLKRNRSLMVFGVHWLLLVLHTGILTNCLTITGPYKESDPVALGWRPEKSIRGAM